MAKKILKYIGLILISGFLGGTVAFIIYQPILEILGLSGVREHLDTPFGGPSVILGGLAGVISGSIGVWLRQKNRELIAWEDHFWERVHKWLRRSLSI